MFGVNMCEFLARVVSCDQLLQVRARSIYVTLPAMEVVSTFCTS